jgi:hypothetical protein
MGGIGAGVGAVGAGGARIRIIGLMFEGGVWRRLEWHRGVGVGGVLERKWGV